MASRRRARVLSARGPSFLPVCAKAAVDLVVTKYPQGYLTICQISEKAKPHPGDQKLSMDVRLSQEQELLRQSARDFLSKECPMEKVRGVADGDTGLVAALWEQASALGWPGLIHDDSWGGSGLGLVDMALVLEESGRVLMPGALLASTAVASLFVARSPNEALKERLLAGLVSGQVTATLATVEENGGWDPELISCAAQESDGGLRLAGTKLFVPDAGRADHFVVTARLPDSSLVLAMVARRASGLAIRDIPYVDESRSVGQLDLDDVTVAAGDVLASGQPAETLLVGIFDVARVAISAESCGAAAAVLEMSTDYAKTRQQFDRPIGSFQAIQHKLADMYVMLESARSAVYYAAWAVDNREPGAHPSACLAKAYCSEAFSRIAGEGIQIHGGMGFTWEADLHLYYKRAKASEAAFGDPVWNREQAARALMGPGAA